MAEISWQKDQSQESLFVPKKTNKWVFMVGGLVILVGVILLTIFSTTSSAQFFITVQELSTNSAKYWNETVRISGAVIGESIEYDSENLILKFTIANIPADFDDLATALHDAVNDPNQTRLQVIVNNEVMPDLLQHEAQAILTGKLGPDGIFYATELLLKCPSRFQETLPEGLEHPEV